MIALIFLCLAATAISQQQKKTVTVGIAAVEDVLPSFMAFSRSGGAIGLALDRMHAEGITNGFEFRFMVNYTECSSQAAVGVALEHMVKQKVDLIIGPPCPSSAEMIAYLSTYYKKTMLGWGFLIDPIFSDNDRFPYLTKVIPDSLQMMEALVPMFQMLEWNRVAIFYTPNEVQYCDTIIKDADTTFGDDSTYVIDIVQKVTWDGQDNDYIRDQLFRTKNTARIIVMCLDTPQSRRKFMKIVSLMDMVSEEYVYVMLGMRGFGFGQVSRSNGHFNWTGSFIRIREDFVSDHKFSVHALYGRYTPNATLTISNGLTPFWEDLENNHADDAIVKEAAKRMLTANFIQTTSTDIHKIHCIDINGDDVDPQKLKDFRDNVVERVREDPLYCSTQACLSNDGKSMATWARHLHDVFYLYGLALNDSLTMDPSGGHANASTLTEAMKRSFVGLTGSVTINANGSRIPLFSVYVLDANFNQVTAINFTIIDGTPVMTKGYTHEATTLWGSRGGLR
ncbi:unnamed protein product [Haemonchus placei]|uniref:ANF_receptor domain-containing protein n=1 Tax=Haemonchus placei TaxID=6290 RepID=A0A158QLI6_HAEPC|nr:unnamed protein product [Haemonchus placei]